MTGRKDLYMKLIKDNYLTGGYIVYWVIVHNYDVVYNDR